MAAGRAGHPSGATSTDQDEAMTVLLGPRGALAGLLLLAASCCPPLRSSYTSPRETLLSWQSHLCRDDPVGEYACLSYGFKQRMAGFASYHAARQKLLDDEPLLTWLLGRADLLDHVDDARLDRETGAASITLTARGRTFVMTFVLETVATAELDDGQRLTGRVERPLGELLVDQAGAQWLRFDRPHLDRDQLLALRALTFEPRWKIDDIQGLTPRTEMIP